MKLFEVFFFLDSYVTFRKKKIEPKLENTKSGQFSAWAVALRDSCCVLIMLSH